MGAHVRSREGAASDALMLLPGLLIVFTGFNAGGYFPITPAIVAVALTQLLAVRVLQAERPFEGFAPSTLLALAALALYATLTLASSLWSHSLGRAFMQFDRAWAYLLTLLLFGAVHADERRLRLLVRGLAAGALVVCAAGLLSRVAPDVLPTAPNVANERLSYPVTYWNALGLLAVFAILLCLHLTCDLAERRAVRALAAGALPLAGAALFFTFSRGAIAVGALGLLLYVLLARPRGLLGGLLAVMPASAVLAAIAYRASLLDTVDPTTPAAVAQGHRVALATALCCAGAAFARWWLCGRLDGRAHERPGLRGLAKGARLAAICAAVGLLMAGALALGAPQRVQADWQRFVSGATPHGTHGDLRRRLTDPSNNGRTDLWRVALGAFEGNPAHGAGAGMYQTVWDRRRPLFVYTVNAHSLYLQAMAELGLPGLAALVALLAAALVGLALRARPAGRARPLYAIVLALAAVWALHAGVDWDWEMPVLTLPFIALTGAALGPGGERGASSGWRPRHGARLGLSMLCLLTLAAPALAIGSQRHLDDAAHALYSSDCSAAGSAALSSLHWLDMRAEPYEILGLCDVRRGFPRLGVEAFDQAVQRDPGSWQAYYGRAIAKAAAGLDPRGDVARAVSMDPLEPLVREEARRLRAGQSLAWVRAAPKLIAGALKSSDLSFASR
jgi:O-Antigen ligase